MQNEEGYFSPQGLRLLHIPQGLIPQRMVSHTRASLTVMKRRGKGSGTGRLEVPAEGAKDFRFRTLSLLLGVLPGQR